MAVRSSTLGGGCNSCDLLHELREDNVSSQGCQQVKYAWPRLFLDLFLMTFGINVIIGVYVGFILPLRGIQDYEHHLGKRVTYVATVSGVISFFSIVIAVWKCFGFWTVPMIFIVFMGYLMSSHFFPNNQFGSFLSGLTFLMICFSSQLIDHEGYLHYGHSEDD